MQEGDKTAQQLLAQSVIVLAKGFVLSRPQLHLLERGLSFVPTIGIGRGQRRQFQLDLQQYHRKLKLACYFKGAQRVSRKPFMGPSEWSPPPNKLPEEINKLIDTDLKTFNKYYSHSKPVQEGHNLLVEEVRALRQLERAKNIIVKPADKGSAVVIMGRDQYIFEVERQLNDSVYYKKLAQPIYQDTVPLLDIILNSLKKKRYINTKQLKYLKGDSQPRARRFYILPKIHKEPVKWTVPFEIPAGRPIVSDCGSETYYTAEFIDYYLNPLSSKHPAYVKDTYHFIELVKGLRIPTSAFFFSMDVDSLYTNIDIDSGIDSVKKIFLKYPDPKRPDAELIQLLDINLRRNDFVFDEKYYLQIKGTAMGKRFAPAYANIFMANWEEGVFMKCKKKPLHYLRYLDDIWGVWDDTQEEFQAFLAILNSYDPSITLKSETHHTHIDFLDTTVYKGSTFSITGQLDVKVFFKKTDTHALLYRSSFHPAHTFKGIVKSQLLRFWRICTQRQDFNVAVGILFKSLRGRGYTRPFLRSCLKTFLQQRDKGEREIIPLICTYNSGSRILNKHLKNNFERFQDSAPERLNPEVRVISAYRRNRNLKDFLVRAKLTSLNVVKKPQLLDRYFCTLWHVRNCKNGKVFQIQQSFSTGTKNCIYLIYCFKCGAKYVGETGNSLSTRMVQHRYNIRHKKETGTLLIRHFLSHGMDSMRVAGLQYNELWTDKDRKRAERQWIYRLDTREPWGLNLKRN